MKPAIHLFILTYVVRVTSKICITIIIALPSSKNDSRISESITQSIISVWNYHKHFSRHQYRVPGVTFGRAAETNIGTLRAPAPQTVIKSHVLLRPPILVLFTSLKTLLLACIARLSTRNYPTPFVSFFVCKECLFYRSVELIWSLISLVLW